MHALLRAANPAAGHHWLMPPPETPGHWQASLGQSLVGSLLLSPGSWCTQDFVCALQHHCLLYNALLVKAMVFSDSHIWMWEVNMKKAECQRIDVFELWCWRRLFRFPWTAKRSNQSILKEINPEYSFKGLWSEAETPILWPPDAKNWLIGKDADAGQDWGQEKGVTED